MGFSLLDEGSGVGVYGGNVSDRDNVGVLVVETLDTAKLKLLSLGDVAVTGETPRLSVEAGNALVVSDAMVAELFMLVCPPDGSMFLTLQVFDEQIVVIVDF